MKEPFNASLSPEKVKAGETCEFILKISIGANFPEKARLIFDLPGQLGMSHPSLMHQEDYGFMEAYVHNPETKYTKRIWDMEIADFSSREKNSWRGMGARMFVLDLDKVKPEDTLEVHWGETGRGYGPGCRVTHVVPAPGFSCPVNIRLFDSHDKGLPDYGRSFKGYKRPEPLFEKELRFDISPQKPKTIQVIRKTDKTLLAGKDMFWNTVPPESLEYETDSKASPIKNSHNVLEYPDKNINITSSKLSLLKGAPMHNAFENKNIYWGDVHTHSCYSVDCVEREKMDRTPSDLGKFAKESAGLDFYAVTDHHQPADPYRKHVGAKGWEDIVKASEALTRNGEFLFFPGFEFRGVGDLNRGDTAIIFNDIPDYNQISDTPWNSIQELWETFKGLDYLTIPHFHSPGRLSEGEWYLCPEKGIEPVLEIFSCHGSFERPDALEMQAPLMKAKRFDRFGSYFVKNGYKYGFVANSDGHKGVTGTNGITAVYSEKLDKGSIVEAYRKRHTYASTNARIKLVFTGNGKLMGSIVPNTSKKILHIDVTGENNLKKIDMFRNGEHYKALIPEGMNYRNEIRVREDSPSSWYVRVTQHDNHIAWSSPVWFE